MQPEIQDVLSFLLSSFPYYGKYGALQTKLIYIINLIILINIVPTPYKVMIPKIYSLPPLVSISNIVISQLYRCLPCMYPII